MATAHCSLVLHQFLPQTTDTHPEMFWRNSCISYTSRWWLSHQQQRCTGLHIPPSSVIACHSFGPTSFYYNIKIRHSRVELFRLRILLHFWQLRILSVELLIEKEIRPDPSRVTSGIKNENKLLIPINSQMKFYAKGPGHLRLSLMHNLTDFSYYIGITIDEDSKVILRYITTTIIFTIVFIFFTRAMLLHGWTIPEGTRVPKRTWPLWMNW